MAVKINVKISLKTLKNLTKKKIVSKSFQKRLGRETVDAVKKSIAIGKSPVQGEGRFVGYKADRAGASFRENITKTKGDDAGSRGIRATLRREAKRTRDRSKFYPNSVKKEHPGKRNRPVNLKLSGKLIKAIKWKPSTGGVIVGLISASRNIKNIFEAHNEGTNIAKKVPRRALLPTGQGEQFTSIIRRRINNLYFMRIRDILRRRGGPR